MDHINIGNLFSNGSRVDNYIPLDVNSLYNTQKNLEEQNLDFNINKLINVREERRQEVINKYRKVFRICLKKINEANRLNTTDMIFEIPQAIFGCSEYSQFECINYIEKKLRNLYLDTLPLSKKSLFISWKNIQSNINNSNKNQNKNKNKK
jgi:hypothetical protein